MANHIINVSSDEPSKINLKIPSAAAETPKYVRGYRANSHKVREFFPAIEARIRVRKHKASSDAATLVAAHSSYLTEEELEIARFIEQQLRTQAELRTIDSGMAAELDLVGARKKVFAVLFTLAAAAASAAGAAISAGVDQKRPTAAVAAAAAILLVALGKWIDSALKKSERGVKKHREIIKSMIVSGKFAIDDLTGIYLLARETKAEAESISKLVGDGEEVAKKVAALNMSFQELQRKAIRGGLDASSAREAVLDSIFKNLE